MVTAVMVVLATAILIMDTMAITLITGEDIIGRTGISVLQLSIRITAIKTRKLIRRYDFIF